MAQALVRLHKQFDELLIERFCEGIEITVGVLESIEPDSDAAVPSRLGALEVPGSVSSRSPVRGFQPHALPPIWIKPATDFYDFDAKYTRDDTQYIFDGDQMGLEPHELEGLGVLAVEVFEDLGCRHMARVDFILDANHRAWVLEANTIPGFTSHSLLPMAAGYAGIELPALCDRLVQLAAADQ